MLFIAADATIIRQLNLSTRIFCKWHSEVVSW